MKKDGLERMLEFLDFLREQRIHFWIEQQDPDGLRVTMTLVGVRIEVYFTVEDMSFSVFKGSEEVILDEKILYDLIRENWAGPE